MKAPVFGRELVNKVLSCPDWTKKLNIGKGIDIRSKNE